MCCVCVSVIYSTMLSATESRKRAVLPLDNKEYVCVSAMAYRYF